MPRRYANAPIAEAVIDLKVEWPDASPLGVFEELGRSLALTFPVSLPIRAVEMGYRQSAGPDAPLEFSSTQEVTGIRLENQFNTRVLQLQRAGFTYSHLPKYTNWETFQPEAEILWGQFVHAAKIERVTRAAVRYINKIVLPGRPSDVKIYSNLHLGWPTSLKTPPEAYLTQIQLPLDASVDGARAIVHSGTKSLGVSQFELLLDIDVFADTIFGADSNEVWQVLDRLRALKNDVFEACITDPTREIIK